VSVPVVIEESDGAGNSVLVSIVPNIGVSVLLKKKMCEVLTNAQRQVVVRFEPCTRESFFRGFDKGCFLLCLFMIAEVEDGLILEELNGKALVLPFGQIREYYLANPERLGPIEVLILSVSTGRPLAERFCELIREVNRTMEAKRRLEILCGLSKGQRLQEQYSSEELEYLVEKSYR